MRLVPLLLLASACAATGAGPSSGETELERELAGRTAGAERDCVPISAGTSLVPRGPQTLVHASGETIWVNRLAARCPGLDETSQILIEIHGNQYCRGDHLRARHAGQSIAAPICILGRFTPYRR